MHLMLFAVLLSLILPACGYREGAQADQSRVSGVLTADGKTTELKYGYVLDYGDSLRIWITDKPMTHDEADGWDNDVAKSKNLRGLWLGVAKDTKQLEYSYVFHDALAAFPVNIDELGELEFDHFDKNAVAGRLFSSKAASWRDKPYTYDVKFKLAVKPLFDPVAVRVTGQGVETAPGKAFADYHKVAMTGSYEELRQYLSEVALKELKNADSLKEMQNFMKLMKPAELTIKNANVQADTAELTVEGSRGGKMPSATIKMKLEKGMWKIVEEKWKGNSR